MPNLKKLDRFFKKIKGKKVEFVLVDDWLIYFVNIKNKTFCQYTKIGIGGLEGAKRYLTLSVEKTIDIYA